MHRERRGPVTLALGHCVPLTPPVSAGCPEPVGEDVCSHPRGVPGGAAEAHDRLGAHRLQAPWPQGAAAAQNLRCAGAGAGLGVRAWGGRPAWGGPGAALPENPVKRPQEPCCWRSDVIRGSLGTVGSGESSGNQPSYGDRRKVASSEEILGRVPLGSSLGGLPPAWSLFGTGHKGSHCWDGKGKGAGTGIQHPSCAP